MLSQLKNTKKHQKYTATHEIDDAVLFTEDKHISQAEKKRRLAELTRALAVMGIRPSSFYAFHTKGQTEQVKEMLDDALKKRTLQILHKAEPRLEEDEEYNPHVDWMADMPTLHEAFQFLMKTYVDDVVEKKAIKKAGGKANKLAMGLSAFGDGKHNNNFNGRNKNSVAGPKKKMILTSEGLVEADSIHDKEVLETEAKILELQKKLAKKGGNGSNQTGSELYDLKLTDVMDNVNDLDLEDPFGFANEDVLKKKKKKKMSSLAVSSSERLFKSSSANNLQGMTKSPSKTSLK